MGGGKCHQNSCHFYVAMFGNSLSCCDVVDNEEEE